ncbi:MAG: ABC transporter ATP-binding protein, partial [Akkermansia sp.]|nr:ABC transporter ATP-binding protein [Akkermansia sp.]
LQVRDLTVEFHSRAGVNYAVNGVSFDLDAGETLGIVGESGSGKSVTCSTLMGLLPSPPARIGKDSRAWFDGIDLLHAPEKEHARLRGKRISMIFQDPMTCLNPCMCIGDQVAEPLVLHQGLSWREARRLAVEELARTGIPDPEKRARAYPHEFSGGMRQRVMIAMALITRPQILIADEPTTALDVTVQKQVLDLLRARQQELGTAIILITHDLGVVRQYAHRIQVMYAGSIVESAPAEELIRHPLHAYTRALMASIPGAADKGRRLQTIPGLPPTLREPVRGCAFRPRNTLGNPALCLTDRTPELIEASPGHWVRNCPGCTTSAP